jgi:hypothetical protein
MVYDRVSMASLEGIPTMMDDHYTISKARNHLADALKVLLKAEIMTADDFSRSRQAAQAAVGELDDLLRQSHGHSAKS